MDYPAHSRSETRSEVDASVATYGKVSAADMDALAEHLRATKNVKERLPNGTKETNETN
jgi:hypothetical protein